jgi:hypothetical protein
LKNLIPDADNNDGISVIDVTDPESPAYCFVSVTGTESEADLEMRVPLSGEQYARAYYPLPTSKEMEDKGTRLSEENVVEVIATLHGEKMVTLDMLAEAWPQEYQSDPEALSKVDQSTPSEEAEVPSTIPSLTDLTMRPAVAHALETGDTTQIEELLWMPDKAKLIESVLHDTTPFPESGLPLLEKVIHQGMKLTDATLDLSKYTLSPTQVLTLVSSVNGLKSLNLSNNPAITTETVKQLLMTTSSLTRLVLLGCPAITNDDLKDLLVTDAKLFYRLESLVHPLFLRHDSSYINAFSYIGLVEDRWMVTSCSLAFFTPSNIVQALTDFLGAYAMADRMDSGQLLGSSHGPLSTFCGAHRKPDQKWGARSVVAFPHTSVAALNGEGWAIILDAPMYNPTAESVWGFVRRLKHPESEGQDESKPASDAPAFEVHDLRSFLAIMADEGRPPVAEEDISKLEGILKKLEEDRNLHLVKTENMVEVQQKVTRLMARSFY